MTSKISTTNLVQLTRPMCHVIPVELLQPNTSARSRLWVPTPVQQSVDQRWGSPLSCKRDTNKIELCRRQRDCHSRPAPLCVQIGRQAKHQPAIPNNRRWGKSTQLPTTAFAIRRTSMQCHTDRAAFHYTIFSWFPLEHWSHWCCSQLFMNREKDLEYSFMDQFKWYKCKLTRDRNTNRCRHTEKRQ